MTLVVLVAFASNSILTRLALGAGEIDAATFTAVRLVSGAGMLGLLVWVGSHRRMLDGGRSAAGPIALFAYAVPFSFAYVYIGAAVGALVLFGAVQVTMIAYGLWSGERPGALAWAGVTMAVSGLVWLTVPSAAGRPDPLGLGLMALAGIAWGVYTLAGRRAPDPVAANAWSFLWSSPLAVAVMVVARSTSSAAPSIASRTGVMLAILSGAVTSGLGYALWYRVLPRLTVTQAAVAQLTVPVIAAFGGVLLLGERLQGRLLVSGVAILGGVGMVLLARARRRG